MNTLVGRLLGTVFIQYFFKSAMIRKPLKDPISIWSKAVHLFDKLKWNVFQAVNWASTIE